MSNRRKILMTPLLAAVLGIAFALWQWRREPDLAGAEHPFNTISIPLKTVSGTYFMYGGSVYVHAVDSKGVEVDLCFPIHYTPRGYPEAYYQAKSPSDPAGIRLKDPEQARKIALHWLTWSGDGDQYTRAALAYLSGWTDSTLNAVLRDGPKVLFE